MSSSSSELWDLWIEDQIMQEVDKEIDALETKLIVKLNEDR